jgi:hypothetical protein
MVDAEFEDRDPPGVFEETDALSSARTIGAQEPSTERRAERREAVVSRHISARLTRARESAGWRRSWRDDADFVPCEQLPSLAIA